MKWLSFIAALLLALVHLQAGKLNFLGGVPRSRWLSAAGGISVAYVFLHLLPELAEAQQVVEEAVSGTLGFFEHHVYLVALIGLIIFYGLERMAKLARGRADNASGGKDTNHAMFWLHIVSFSIYNILIGYLLVLSQDSLRDLLLLSGAMALHFTVNDFGLREHHQESYTNIGRWLLAFAVLTGWGVGSIVEIPEAATSLLIAFLAGGIILNVLKEELPEERQSRFNAFLIGGLSYAAILIWL